MANYNITAYLDGSGTVALPWTVIQASDPTVYAGSGAFTANARQKLNLFSHAFAGAGALTPNARQKLNLFSHAFAGAGSLTSLAQPPYGFAFLAGAGSLVVIPALAQSDTPAFVGAGSLTSSARVAEPALAVFNGSGAFSASSFVAVASSAVFGGSGAFSATTTTATEVSSATFRGSGTLIAIAQPPYGFVFFGGSGAFSATAAATEVSSAVIAGVGSLTSHATVAEPALAVFAGSGTLGAVAGLALPESATFASTGALVSIATLTAGSAATFASTGALVSIATLTAGSGAAFAGAGSLVMAPVVETTGASSFSGAGNFGAIPIPQTPRVQVWSVTHTSTNLSGVNTTTVTLGVPATYSPAFGSESFISGKFYWEGRISNAADGNSAPIGIGNTSSSIADGQWVGTGTDTLGLYIVSGGTCELFYNDSLVYSVTITSAISSDRYAAALDLVNSRFWWRNVTRNSGWYGASTTPSDPASNSGGFDLTQGGTATILNTPVVPAVTLYANAEDTATGYFQPETWLGTAPAGFGGFDVPPAIVSFVATGSLSVVPEIAVPESATFAGAGALRAVPGLALPESAAFTGVGALRAVPGLALPESAAFAGAGSFSAVSQVAVLGSAAFAGAGSLYASLGVVAGFSSFAGSGAIYAAIPVITAAARALFPGSGSLAVIVTEVAAASAASFVGGGGIAVSTKLLGAGSTALSGAGSVVATLLYLPSPTGPQQWSEIHVNGRIVFAEPDRVLLGGPDNVNAPVFGTQGVVSGLYYWESAVSTGTDANSAVAGIGNALSSTNDGQYLGIGPDTIGIYGYGTAMYLLWNGVAQTIPTLANSGADAIGCALDLVHGKFWWRNVTENSAWFGAHTTGIDDPTIPSTGFDLTQGGAATILNAPVVPGIVLYTAGATGYGYFQPAQLTGAAPAGYSLFNAPITTASLGGAGSLVAVETPPSGEAYPILASFAGAGSLRASLTWVSHNQIFASFVGAGSVTLPWTIIQARDPTVYAGAGSLTAFLIGPWQIPASFAGAGSLGTYAAGSLVAAASLRGAGSLVAYASETAMVTASLGGAGSLVLRLVGPVPIAASLGGAGSLGAYAATTTGTVAAFTGSGSLVAPIGGIFHTQLSASFAGAASAVFNDPLLYLIVNPPNPSIPAGLAPGQPVATLTGVRTDGRAFAGNFIFDPPNWDDPPAHVSGSSGAGVYAITQPGGFGTIGNLIINPNGPGVGSAGGTIENVTISAADPPVPYFAAIGGTGSLIAFARVSNQAIQWPGTGSFAGTGALLLPSLPALGVFQEAFAGAGALSPVIAQIQSANLASFAGSGALTSAAYAALSSSVRLAAAGTFGADVAVIRGSSTSFSGAGSLVAVSVVTENAVAAFGGSGTARLVVGVALPESAAFGGSGVLAAQPVTTTTAATAFGGAGSLGAAVQLALPESAAFGGSGVLAAQPATTTTAATTFSGAGLLRADPFLLHAGQFLFSPAFAGSATLSAPIGVAAATASSFAGAGALSPVLALGYVINPTPFVGAGSLTGFLAGPLRIPASFAGTGALAASLTWVTFNQIFASFVSAGSLAAQYSTVIAPSSARLAGVGSISTVVANAAVSSAAFAASGSLTTALPLLLASCAGTLAGVGALSATIAAQYVTNPAEFSGAGALVATTTSTPTINAVFSGAGAFTAAPRAKDYDIDASFAAIGSFAAEPTIAVGTAVVFAGTGSLGVGGVEDAFAPPQEFSGSGGLSVSASVFRRPHHVVKGRLTVPSIVSRLMV